MNLFTVAIGEQYEIEAERLAKSLKQNINIFTKSNKKYKKVSTDSLIDGLFYKTNFANYIGNINGNIFFMDADMFTLQENPFQDFSVRLDTDFAYVPYGGKWHLPDKIRQESFDYHGHKINSGFMYFKNLQIAKEICNKWANEFLKRPQELIKSEYDEWALMISLIGTKYNIELLDNKWNNWELNTEDEIKNSDSIFFQSHNMNFKSIKINNQK